MCRSALSGVAETAAMLFCGHRAIEGAPSPSLLSLTCLTRKASPFLADGLL